MLATPPAPFMGSRSKRHNRAHHADDGAGGGSFQSDSASACHTISV